MTFWTSCFYSLERSFLVLEYRERHFPCQYCLKKQVGIMVIFGQKPWVNPFVKMSIFFTFRTCCFYSVEKSFFGVKYRKKHFPSLFCPKKKFGKIAIFGPKPLVNPFGKMSIIRLFFGQKPWINPFVKMSIFRFFLTSCFYSLEGRSFVLEYSERHFPCLYCLKKTFWNNGHFWTKTMS